MKIPKGFEIDQGRSDDCVLELKRNLCGTKNAGRIWNKHLTNRNGWAGRGSFIPNACWGEATMLGLAARPPSAGPRAGTVNEHRP